MADANSVQNAIDGVDVNSKGLSYRKVNLLRDAEIGDLEKVTDGTAEGPNSSTSALDHITTLAKILTRRYKGMDIFDMVAAIYDSTQK